jgi:hypothetical protein|tara:strand:- start:599 stop:892 length:294 start_codon:yes stop_codon:yes gene_type:complete
MTDCEHNTIREEEHMVKEYYRNVPCIQDEPRDWDPIVKYTDKKESEYHAEYCSSGESNCFTWDFEEQIHYESICVDCGEEMEMMEMEGLNFVIYGDD